MWIHVSYHFFGVEKFVITVIVPQTNEYCHWGCNEGNDGRHCIAISGCIKNAARIRFWFDLTFGSQSMLQIDARHHQVKGVVPFSHDAWSSHSGIKQALRLAKNWLNLAYFRYTSIGITEYKHRSCLFYGQTATSGRSEICWWPHAANGAAEPRQHRATLTRASRKASDRARAMGLN